MMEGILLAGRYRLEEQIGSGGLAIVYRARDTVLERPVAVKVLREEFARDAQIVARFRREAHAAAKLNHPHIVQIYDTGQDEEQGLYFLVMEYLPEPDLKRAIMNFAPLPGRKVVQVAIQCGQALAYAHRQGLVHRDVKPHNILFTDEGVAKLSDFGIAAAAGETGAVSPGMVVGSAAYISPEQAQGKPVGPQSDLYSLGCVMFEALTGRTPFVGESPAQVAAMHVHERVPSPRELNPAVTPAEEFVVRKALSKDLVHRYQSADEMLADLGKLLAGDELDRTGVIPRSEDRTMALRVTGAQPPPPVERAPRPAAPMPVMPARRVPSATRPSEPGGSLVWATLVAVLVVLLALGVTAWMVYVYFYSGSMAKMVQVPTLQGTSEAQARLAITEAGLKLLEPIAYRSDPDSTAGTVLEQSPAAGTTVRANSPVTLVVNKGVEVASVPDLVGATHDDASRLLRRAGLLLGKASERFSPTVPAGQVLEQSIAAGTRVEKGTAVDVTLSQGPETEALPPEELTPGGATEGGDKPVVTCQVDATYESSDPRARRYLLTITGTGEKQGQRLQVFKRDETGGSKLVLEDTIDPGVSKKISIVGVGNTSISVYHEGQKVEDFEFPAGGPAP
jgi:serine/threonine-protein kinase